MPAPGLKHLVAAALPPGATPISSCVQPLHSHVLASAPVDVEKATREQIAAQFGDQPHVLLSITAADLDPTSDRDLMDLAERTDGGLVVVGVGYALSPAAEKGQDDRCPECGSTEVDVMGPPNDRAAGYLPGAIVCQCRDCGTAWDVEG